MSVNGGSTSNNIDFDNGVNVNDHTAAIPPLFYNPLDSNTIYFATNKIYTTFTNGAFRDTISKRIPVDTQGFITSLRLRR